MKNYRTIREHGSHEIHIKKSRFICTLKRTESEREAVSFIDQIKKEHYKASHNCYAYLIGESNHIQRAFDDGEPSGTAGVPILEVLKKRNVKNVTAVVTRYFGGTKLGAGGLIRAYGQVTNEALNHIGIVEKQLQQFVSVSVSYPVSGKLQSVLEESAYTIYSTDYTSEVTYNCLIPIEKVDVFMGEAMNWTSGNVTFKSGTKAWIEVSVAN
ncbi:YigZ family protein [Alkalibacterium sp. f15]|uniref:YigZ family protein n=1 Tax=Alkalibacterium sp. f15 TaxID=3414029 RepID=UPI003BF86355